MSKDRYMQQQSIEDAMAIDSQDSNEGDNQTHLFKNFLEHDIVNNVRNVPFDAIISNRLRVDGDEHNFNIERNNIPWYCESDRRTIHGRTICTFRFPNVGHPNSYNQFELRNNSLFMRSERKYHGVDEWYEFIGHNFCEYVRGLLLISGMQNEPCRTRIFVNKCRERTDIVLNFDKTNRRIILTFEIGDPARSHQITNYSY